MYAIWIALVARLFLLDPTQYVWGIPLEAVWRFMNAACFAVPFALTIIAVVAYRENRHWPYLIFLVPSFFATTFFVVGTALILLWVFGLLQVDLR